MEQVKRGKSLPSEASNCRRDELYYRIEVADPQQLLKPILNKDRQKRIQSFLLPPFD